MSENEPPPTYDIATNRVPSVPSNIPPSYSFVTLNQHSVVQQQQQQQRQRDASSFIPVIYDTDPSIEQTRLRRSKRLDYSMRGLLVVLFVGGVIYTVLLLIKKFVVDFTLTTN